MSRVPLGPKAITSMDWIFGEPITGFSITASAPARTGTSPRRRVAVVRVTHHGVAPQREFNAAMKGRYREVGRLSNKNTSRQSAGPSHISWLAACDVVSRRGIIHPHPRGRSAP